MSTWKICFPVRRINALRTLAPIIKEVIDDPGFEAEIILVSGHDERGSKAYLSPMPERLPESLRLGSKITVEDDFARLGRLMDQSDAIISVEGRPRMFREQEEHVPFKSLWCSVFDSRHSCLPKCGNDKSDLIFWPSPYYLDYAVTGKLQTREFLRPLSRFVGFSRFDPIVSVPREDIFCRFNLDPNKRVLTYIPDIFCLMPLPIYVTDWFRYLWLVDSKVLRMVNSLIRLRSLDAVRQSMRLGYHEMMLAMREFCDRNDAQLVIAPRRRKNALTKRLYRKDEERIADTIITEENEFPQTMALLSKVSDMMVCNYRSGCLIDATTTKTPFITVSMPEVAFTKSNNEFCNYYDEYHGHFPGRSWVVEAEAFIDSFGQQGFADYALDEELFNRQRRKNIGPMDGLASRRIIRSIKRKLTTRNRNHHEKTANAAERNA
ncbi:MAG: hypothetical protein QGF71_01110 [Rhodospirillales bacterium]|jgi:hypothetical protein|nr:hypothetical protein [Rhodospirillaceae bacterium]MDP6108657.1 hypothetical protein [Rhodospirillales bacterium]